jgi:hypothetical protein
MIMAKSLSTERRPVPDQRIELASDAAWQHFRPARLGVFCPTN